MKTFLPARWALLAALAGILAVCGHASMVICIEADSGATNGDAANGLQQGGCINTIPGTQPLLFVAADGEVEFHPFGLVDFAVSDAIQLNPAWAPDPTFASAFGPGLWTLQPNTFVWYLLEGAGEPLLEPIGKWFMAGATWSAPFDGLELVILDPNNCPSDIITLGNTGPDGTAAITFQSGVPEPATLSLIGLGLACAAFIKRRRQ